MKKRIWILLLATLAFGLGACTKPLDNTTEEEQEQTGDDSGLDEWTRNVYYYANTFAYGRMSVYYLWAEEIEKDLKAWKETDEPIEKVYAIRYKDSQGNDIDKWTMLTDDYDSFMGSVNGIEKTAGYDFYFARTSQGSSTLCALVTFVYADSPAEKAGLQRGDIILQLNGKAITLASYSSDYYTLVGGDKYTVSLYDTQTHDVGKTLTIEPVEMYENPILLTKVFDCEGKKVGYLHYTSFTLDSCKDLIKVCSDFKAAGISELIVDLRYNGGGYAITEQAIASMLAPEAAVTGHQVLSTEVFNKTVSDYYASNEELDPNTYFETEYEFTSGGKDYQFSTAGANIGINRVYFIVTSGTASASEALIGELVPYLDVIVVGEQTHGKYCSGLPMKAEDFFDEYADQISTSFATNGKKYAANWGLYVMFSRFADKNHKTLCMPNGISPDYQVEDDPQDGFALGSPKETMLAKVLSLCGYKTKAQAALPADDQAPMHDLKPVFRTDDLRPGSGRRIILPHQVGLR